MTSDQFVTASGVEVIRIRNDVVSANTFVLQADSTTGEVCLVIDPGSDAAELEAVLRGVTSTPTVLLTHGHFDHVLGVHALQESGSPVYMDAADAPFLRRNNFYMKALSVGHSTRPFEFHDIATELPDIPGLTARSAPGHSPGSYAFRFHDVLVTGDTILSRHILSPTISGCDEGQQVRSVESLLDEMMPGTIVLPGHGRPADVQHLMDRNDDFRTVVEYMRNAEGA